MLHGLHAAHVAKDGAGKALELVHRDVTPENILVGADGTARLMDFGVAKAQGRLHATKDGGVKGKLAYLAPEQVGGDVTARTDLYAAGLVLWEMLVGERVIEGESEPELLVKALDPVIVAPSTRVPEVSPALDAVVLRALCKEPEGRFSTGTEQAEAIGRAVTHVASPAEVAEWVRIHGGTRLAKREESVRSMLLQEATPAPLPRESGSASVTAPPRPQDNGIRGMIVMALAALAVVTLGLLYSSRTSPPPLIAEPAAASSPPLVSPVPVPVPVPVPDPASSPAPTFLSLSGPPSSPLRAPSSARAPPLAAPHPAAIPRGTSTPTASAATTPRA